MEIWWWKVFFNKIDFATNLISLIISSACGFESPLKTSLTNMAPIANPSILLVSVTQYLHGSSPPSDPIKAFRRPVWGIKLVSEVQNLISSLTFISISKVLAQACGKRSHSLPNQVVVQNSKNKRRNWFNFRSHDAYFFINYTFPVSLAV